MEWASFAYENGTFHLSLANGNRYEGEWKNGLKHGHGKFFHLDSGQLQEGLWYKGVSVTSVMVDMYYRQATLQPTKYPIPKLCDLSAASPTAGDMFLKNAAIMENTELSIVVLSKAPGKKQCPERQKVYAGGTALEWTHNLLNYLEQDGLGRLYLDKVYPHLHGIVENHFGKNTLSTRNRDSNLELPIIGSLVCCESSALDHAVNKLNNLNRVTVHAHAICPALRVPSLNLLFEELQLSNAGHSHFVLVRDQRLIEVNSEHDEYDKHWNQYDAG
ncbi:unnamed protein product [Timema podura]|uniref:MORN repeat-containing protein 3 n=1 Tax=Timema podura TaxID=61482 RepID=A0ABN7NL04_TIMPD|nr:unnamed protein product [Timema podura]